MKVEATHFPSKTVHRLAVVTAAATFPLLFIGGLVTSKGAGLSVPDWPTTFGYNMFLYPWSEMIGDIFYEHSHRLVASGVGLLTILLACSLWFYEPRRWMRWLGAAALGLVVMQGIIGGLRVVLLEETLAIIHACAAQAFFALTVSLVFFTSGEWAGEPERVEPSDAARLQRLSVLVTALIYLQGAFGAVLRYAGAGLYYHLFFAALVTIHVVLLVTRISRSHRGQSRLLRPAIFLGALLVAQLALGLGSYLAKFTPLGSSLAAAATVILTTTHLVTGALMLVTGLALTLRSYRLRGLPRSRPSQGLLAEQLSA